MDLSSGSFRVRAHYARRFTGSTARAGKSAALADCVALLFAYEGDCDDCIIEGTVSLGLVRLVEFFYGKLSILLHEFCGFFVFYNLRFLARIW